MLITSRFLLARLIMDSICNATTIKKIRKMLDFMPTNYKEAYKGTFDRILKQDQERKGLALSALTWICNSRRSLDMTELQHAIASLDEAPEYTPECLESEKAVLSSCLGFLVHSKSSQTVDLVHFSARDFVLEQLNSQEMSSNITIGRAVLEVHGRTGNGQMSLPITRRPENQGHRNAVSGLCDPLLRLPRSPG